MDYNRELELASLLAWALEYVPLYEQEDKNKLEAGIRLVSEYRDGSRLNASLHTAFEESGLSVQNPQLLADLLVVSKKDELTQAQLADLQFRYADGKPVGLSQLAAKIRVVAKRALRSIPADCSCHPLPN